MTGFQPLLSSAMESAMTGMGHQRPKPLGGTSDRSESELPRSVRAEIKQTVLKRGIRRRWQYQSANEMGC
jgi:hypothetical protein